MKTKSALLFILILFSGKLFGQLLINTGNDTILCVTVWGIDTAALGGNPTATGGTEPYVYSWETKHSIGSSTYYASSFLDDTTSANPKIINAGSDSIQFFVSVTDNSGATQKDSITVRFSRFAYATVELFANIFQGDTASLTYGIGQGIEPLNYSWTPNYNISDTSIGNPKAWPDTSTNYQLIITDSIGCVSEPSIFSVYVNSLGITQPSNTALKSYVYPNPVDEKSKIYIQGLSNNNNLSIKVISTTGQIVYTDRLNNSSFHIGNKMVKEGVYLYLILDGKDVVSSGQFVKR
jgi:hypothetical protein